MKTQIDPSDECRVMRDKKPTEHERPPGHVHAFTLIELLTVIAIMAVIAGFTLVVVGRIKRTEYIGIATAEMTQIVKALDDYKAKYGTYPPSNANLPGTYAPWPMTNSLFPQLYYELCGVTNNGTVYTTLDGSAQINVADVQKAFGVGGFINCSKGSGDDITPARNFLLGLRQHQIVVVSNNTILVSLIATSVRGPDLNYQPLRAQDMNPFRYVYPGINNPDSYDLYVQLVISGKSNLVCNWTKQVIVNSPLP